MSCCSTGVDLDEVAADALAAGSQGSAPKAELLRAPLLRVLRHAIERRRLQGHLQHYLPELGQSRQELAENEARFRLLAEHAHDVVQRVAIVPEFRWE